VDRKLPANQHRSAPARAHLERVYLVLRGAARVSSAPVPMPVGGDFEIGRRPVVQSLRARS
jgi:hypothetical protein